MALVLSGYETDVIHRVFFEQFFYLSERDSPVIPFYL